MSRSSRRSGFAAATLALGFIALAPLAGHSLAQGPPAATTSSVVDGVFTPDQAAQGAKQFQQICTSCHTVSEHTGRGFESKWQGSTIGDLFELVSTTMPDGDPGSLKPEEYASIIAFFLNETGYKPGEKELPSDVEALKKIRVEPVPR